MPLLAIDPEARAFEILLARKGKIVVLNRGGTGTSEKLRALINYQGPPPSSKLTSDGGEPTGAVLQFQSSVAKPDIGDVVTDQAKNNHRITEVKYFGHCWNCESTSVNA